MTRPHVTKSVKTLVALSALSASCSYAPPYPAETTTPNNPMSTILQAEPPPETVEYRLLLDSALNFDHNSLVVLLNLRSRVNPDTHCENLRDLMLLWGDAQFAQVLERQDLRIRKRAVECVNCAWGTPRWELFPETQATALDR
jgi:hypothetical protein